MQGNISISFVIALIAIAQLTLSESLVVGVLATLVQCFWRTRKSPTLVQVLFNISTLVVSVILAFGVLDAVRNSGALIPGLVVAALLFFIVNSGLVSLVLALLNSQSVVSVWRNCHRWAFPYYIGGTVVAVRGASLVRVGGRGGGFPIFFLPPFFLFLFLYIGFISAPTRAPAPARVWSNC